MAMDFPDIVTGRYIDLGSLNFPALTGAASWTGWMSLRSRGGELNPMITKADLVGTFDMTWQVSVAGSGPAEVDGSLDTGSGAELLRVGNYGSTAPPVPFRFLAMTYDGTTKRVYIEGVEAGSAAQTGNVVTNAEAVAMGALNTGATIERQIEGLLEDVRLYDRGLSQAEIETMFALRGIDGIVHGLLHRWTMREVAPGVVASGAGSTKDLGPSQFNGTPTNGPIGAETDLRI